MLALIVLHRLPFDIQRRNDVPLNPHGLSVDPENALWSITIGH